MLHKSAHNLFNNGSILKIQLGPETREQGLQNLCLSYANIQVYL